MASDSSKKMLIKAEVLWCQAKVYSLSIYSEGYGRGSNSPIKIIMDAEEAGIGNLLFKGGVLGSQRMK